MLKMITLTLSVKREDFSFSQIKHYLQSLETTYSKTIISDGELSPSFKEILTDRIYEVLEIIGEMSQPIFNRRQEIENRWMRDCSDHQTALEGWIKEYTSLHKPYDKLKDQAYHLFCRVNEIPEDDQ
jgi:DNA-binding transcriptional MerR regulator